MQNAVWWIRLTLCGAVVLFTGLTVTAMLKDGERGMAVAPWTLLAFGALAWAIYPHRKQGNE